MRIQPLLLSVASALIFTACGGRQSDSASFTAPPDFDSTKGQCNPGYTYPPSSPCSQPKPPVSSSNGMRVVLTTINCPASFGVATDTGVSESSSVSNYDKTFSAARGTLFAATAQSTCGAGGSATVRLYRDGTLLGSDSKVGPSVAKVSGTY
ncbi:hypothetical protein [Deinococcus aquatilis]|uniref:hypothetical protein n=1 Tax=Deinococcus aquatilis TaxID=519440 RepID=UPI0003771A02|nr:hypothetical protein [Deinococcus aquatilis]